MIDILKETWSWSKVNSFHQGLTGKGCLNGWHQTYCQRSRGDQNWFADVGLVVHDVLEGYVQGDLAEWSVADAFTEKFQNIASKPLAKRMAQSYYDKLHSFFESDMFVDFFDKCKILESEDEKEFMVGPFKFRGFPDLCVEHEDYGLAIVDYKTSAPYAGEDLKHNLKQLYLYAIPIFETYYRWPDHLIFLHPRHLEIVPIPFDMLELESTRQWCSDTIAKIATWDEWDARCNMDLKDTFFQKQLCNHRFACKHSALKGDIV